VFNAIKKDTSPPKVARFPCSKCGALLIFKPGTQRLACQYCGTENRIEEGIEEIKEYDLHSALAELAYAKPVVETQQIKCEACGAGFKFAESIHAGECPFCGTDIVTDTALVRPINPKSLLPFKINEQEAKQLFRRWLKSLWFAPGKVKKQADDDAKLQGVYIPYWTYDSQTETLYQGARGKVYYVTERTQTFQGGRAIRETRQVPKVEWTPVQGKVARFFDDVLVGANKSLPRQILDHLEPWDLENLVPYDESYLSGFTSEYYQIGLDEGFDEAKRKMDNMIYHDIAFDIGGDEQRIDRFHTQHQQTTYKHCLLPVWSAAFRYRQKPYRFVINGRTGKVQGERPYSVWKIAFAVILGIIVAGGLLVFMERSGSLQQTQYLDQSSFDTMGTYRR
jgi:DNA-directed RNA polymerase subunit M/transcription elongation factor TFIIS